MFKLKVRHPYLLVFNLILLVELLSFLAYFIPALQSYLIALIFIILVPLSIYYLEIGVLVAIAELVIGSKGHLLSANFFGLQISLRLAIWLALIIASVVVILKGEGIKSYLHKFKSYPFYKPFLILIAFIAIGVLNGYLSGNQLNLIFNDVNAWFYLAWLLPLFLVYFPKIEKNHLIKLAKVFSIAILWLSLKTLILLFFFSHNSAIVPDLYLWVRRSGIGEITAMGGGWYRIFIQSQIYVVIAFFLVLFIFLRTKFENNIQRLKYLGTLSVLMSVIIISMSRSFWLALVCSSLLAAIFSWRLKWRLYLKAGIYTLLSIITALILIFIIIKFPYPAQRESVSMNALSERLEFKEDEAALASRWALLPALWKGIVDRPILGSGFGKTISYFSQDPRVLENNPDGLYESYAFEWAYLDTWLKMGFLGLISFLAYLLLILYRLGQEYNRDNSGLSAALAASLLFLLVVNIFTPYLNHPLGLAFVLISSCFIKKNPI
jgi:O-antigen ligase